VTAEGKDFIQLMEQIGEACAGHELGVTIDVLLYLLADCGRQTDMSQQEFVADVYQNMNEIYSEMETDNGGSTHH